MLGEAGATVYCTGRSTRGGSAPSGRPETIEDTAELVSEHGGVGIAIKADHTVEAEVESVFDQIRDQHGRLDILVNDIWGGDDLAVPLLLESDRGLIVEVTDGDHFAYRTNFYYDLVKIAVIRMAFGMARELQKTDVAALAVTPGYMRSEAVLDHWGVAEDNWRDAIKKDPHFEASETPYYVGRAVAALAADPDIQQKSGRVFGSWDLAREYGFTDLDGNRPSWPGHLEDWTGSRFKSCDPFFYSTYWDNGMIESFFPDWPPDLPTRE